MRDKKDMMIAQRRGPEPIPSIREVMKEIKFSIMANHLEIDENNCWIFVDKHEGRVLQESDIPSKKIEFLDKLHPGYSHTTQFCDTEHCFNPAHYSNSNFHRFMSMIEVVEGNCWKFTGKPLNKFTTSNGEVHVSYNWIFEYYHDKSSKGMSYECHTLQCHNPNHMRGA